MDAPFFFAWYFVRVDSDVLRGAGAAQRYSGFWLDLLPGLELVVLMATRDAQYAPEHGSRHGHPAGDQAEDYHCKAHHYLHCFRVFSVT